MSTVTVSDTTPAERSEAADLNPQPGRVAGPRIKGFIPRFVVSLLPLIAVIIFKLLEISLDIPNPDDAHKRVIEPSFWNLSFDLFFAAVGIFFASVLFANEPTNSSTATWVGISIFVLFLAILLNLTLPHFGILTDQVGLRTIVADVLALISFGFCVQTI